MSSSQVQNSAFEGQALEALQPFNPFYSYHADLEKEMFQLPDGRVPDWYKHNLSKVIVYHRFVNSSDHTWCCTCHIDPSGDVGDHKKHTVTPTTHHGFKKVKTAENYAAYCKLHELMRARMNANPNPMTNTLPPSSSTKNSPDIKISPTLYSNGGDHFDFDNNVPKTPPKKTIMRMPCTQDVHYENSSLNLSKHLSPPRTQGQTEMSNNVAALHAGMDPVGANFDNFEHIELLNFASETDGISGLRATAGAKAAITKQTADQDLKSYRSSMSTVAPRSKQNSERWLSESWTSGLAGASDVLVNNHENLNLDAVTAAGVPQDADFSLPPPVQQETSLWNMRPSEIMVSHFPTAGAEFALQHDSAAMSAAQWEATLSHLGVKTAAQKDSGSQMQSQTVSPDKVSLQSGSLPHIASTMSLNRKDSPPTENFPSTTCNSSQEYLMFGDSQHPVRSDLTYEQASVLKPSVSGNTGFDYGTGTLDNQINQMSMHAAASRNSSVLDGWGGHNQTGCLNAHPAAHYPETNLNSNLNQTVTRNDVATTASRKHTYCGDEDLLRKSVKYRSEAPRDHECGHVSRVSSGAEFCGEQVPANATMEPEADAFKPGLGRFVPPPGLTNTPMGHKSSDIQGLPAIWAADNSVSTSAAVQLPGQRCKNEKDYEHASTAPVNVSEREQSNSKAAHNHRVSECHQMAQKIQQELVEKVEAIERRNKQAEQSGVGQAVSVTNLQKSTDDFQRTITKMQANSALQQAACDTSGLIMESEDLLGFNQMVEGTANLVRSVHLRLAAESLAVENHELRSQLSGLNANGHDAEKFHSQDKMHGITAEALARVKPVEEHQKLIRRLRCYMKKLLVKNEKMKQELECRRQQKLNFSCQQNVPTDMMSVSVTVDTKIYGLLNYIDNMIPESSTNLNQSAPCVQSLYGLQM